PEGTLVMLSLLTLAILGNGLSLSGYHLCIHNETRMVSFLAMHKVPYTATKPCGGWLLWKTCTVTLYRMIYQTEYKTAMEQVTKCCDGYAQVGRYCALSVNRSGEFIAKPGSCPTADGLYPGSEDCEWDMDCPGWQKCCQRLGRCFYSTNYSENGGSRLNATVTVKTDYQQLKLKDKGLLNHTRLLQAMVTTNTNVNTTTAIKTSAATVYKATTLRPLANYSPPSITTLTSSNITGTSFCVYWSSQFQSNQTYQVAISKGSEDIQFWETSQTMMEVRGLQPGVLYNVTVTPCACGNQGVPLRISVRTDAQTLDVTARLTNIPFTADLQNTSSQAYQNLSASIIEEVGLLQGLSTDRIDSLFCHQQIYQSLSPEMKAMVDSGQVRIEIRSFSLGSVVVNFTLIFTPIQSQDVSDVSTALLNSLMNSSKYSVDRNNTSIHDSDECLSGENDCSQWAICTNTWSSYGCVCLEGFTDNNPGRPGRACQGRVSQCGTTTTAMTYMTSTPTTVANPTTTLTTATAAMRTATSVSMLKGVSVQCRVAAITVTVAKDFLLNNTIRESALYLGLQECGVNGGNDTHVQLTNETYYTASVTLFNTMDPSISPSGTVEVPKKQLESHFLQCVPLVFMAECTVLSPISRYNMIKDVIMGLGSFQVTVQLMNGTVPLPHNYSLSPDDIVVVEVSLNTSSEQIKVIINKCWATPTPNPADTYSYTFLENSCSLNMYTKVLMNGNSSTSRVSVQIFSFVNLNVIYLHCQVHICVQIGSDTCVPVSASLSKIIINHLAEYNTLHIVGFSCLGVGLTLIFIIGFVCLFYCQRNRIGHYNFSVKPKEENFTYLVFNT
uniref:Uromodulin-like 1 n=1 Tax=Seriola dumerili TaxID=41447 RepID=A0A3B4V676_SERDU